MNPPLVKTTRTAQVSACDGVAKPQVSKASKEAAGSFVRGCFMSACSGLLSIGSRTRCVEGDHHRAEIGCQLEAGLGTLQGDDHALVVLELHTADARDQGAATADHGV